MSPIGQAAADSRVLKVNNFFLKINIFVTGVKASSLKMWLNGQSNRAFFQATWILTMLTLVSFEIVRKPFIRDGEFWRLILLLSRKLALHHPLLTAYHRQWTLFYSDNSGTLKQEKCVSNNQTMCQKEAGTVCLASLKGALSFRSLCSSAISVRVISVLKKEGIVCNPREMVQANALPPL